MNLAETMKSVFSRVTAISLLLLLSACYSLTQDRIEITLVNESNNPSMTYTHVSVISGGDKFTWSEVTPNETKRVTLVPGKTSDPKVTLIYTLGREKKFWESESLSPGVGYRVTLSIDAAAKAYGNVCQLPCSHS